MTATCYSEEELNRIICNFWKSDVELKKKLLSDYKELKMILLGNKNVVKAINKRQL